MASETSVVVTIDDNGRLTVPAPVRRALGIDGRRAELELHIELHDSGGDNEY